MTSTAPAPRAALTGLTGLIGLIALALVLWANVAVQASNNDGVWNEDGLSVALVVGPPPWLS